MGDIAGACQLLRLEKPALGVAEARSTRLLLSFIHRSAWKGNSTKFGLPTTLSTSSCV
jgi:hypothetical protein